MSENVEKVMDLDPGMENDPRKEIDSVESGSEEVITFDLINGLSMSTDYSATDWNGVYDQIPDMSDTVLSLKKMFYQLVITPVADRDHAVSEALEQLSELHHNMGLQNDQYELRPDITNYEKALMMIVNIIIILEGMTVTAQLANLKNIASNFTAVGGGLTDEMIEEFLTNLNEIGSEIVNETAENETAGEEESSEEENNG